MPETMRKVEEENAEAAHVEKECQKTAECKAWEKVDRERVEVRVAAKAAKEVEQDVFRADMLERLMNREMNEEEFAEAMATLDKESEEENPQEVRKDSGDNGDIGEPVMTLEYSKCGNTKLIQLERRRESSKGLFLSLEWRAMRAIQRAMAATNVTMRGKVERVSEDVSQGGNETNDDRGDWERWERWGETRT
jgi:hypothetical protein